MRNWIILYSVAVLHALDATTIVPNWQKWARTDYASSLPCTSDPHSCFGNGECTDNGLCRCDIGWRGSYCSQLDLLPASKASMGLPLNGSLPTWGGSAAWDETRQKWIFLAGSKLYNTTLTSSAGFSEWSSDWASNAAPDPVSSWGRIPALNSSTELDGMPLWDYTTVLDPYTEPDLYGPSYLTRFQSAGSDPAGPYQMVGVDGLGFRADMKRRLNAGADSPLFMLTVGTVDGTGPRGIVIKRSLGSSLEVWDERLVYDFAANGHGGNASWWDCDVKDPSFVIYENGTTVIAYRGVQCVPEGGSNVPRTESVGLLKADSWDSTYTRIGEPIFIDNEDVFIWLTDRGLHMITHSQNTDHGKDHKKKRGGYAFSADGIHRWAYSDWELYPSEIAWSDGSVTEVLKQQRPSLVFSPVSGRPTHLVTGVDHLYDPCCKWYIYGSGWTLVQPLVHQCPAGTVATANGCQECLAVAVGNGRCLSATSKYGQCVCAQCEHGWLGDSCAEPAFECLTEQQGQMSNDGFSSRRHCADSGSLKVVLIETSGGEPISNEDCAAACTAHANRWALDGCCYTWNGKVCHFHPGSDMLPNNGALRFASQCSRIRFESPTNSPLAPPSKSPTNSPSGDPNSPQSTAACATGLNGVTLDISVDSGLQSMAHCADSGEQKVELITSSGQPSIEECAVACAAYANQVATNGCCYSFQGQNKLCHFHPGTSGLRANTGSLRFASQCVLTEGHAGSPSDSPTYSNPPTFTPEPPTEAPSSQEPTDDAPTNTTDAPTDAPGENGTPPDLWLQSGKPTVGYYIMWALYFGYLLIWYLLNVVQC